VGPRKVGFIIGTGLEGLSIGKREKIYLETPYGEHSDIFEVSHNNVIFYCLFRHGKDHLILPHCINYRANIFALKTLGITDVISFAAVGSLRWGINKGDFVVPLDFVDCTKEIIGHFDNNVYHSCMSEVFHRQLSLLVYKIVKRYGRCFYGQVTVGISGPRYPTKAEVRIYRKLGDVIGMTVVKEVILAKEINLRYANCSIVTDKSVEITHEKVVAAAEGKQPIVKNIIEDILRFLPEDCDEIGNI
jgi:5'-methylthioadenosine phosphorylase